MSKVLIPFSGGVNSSYALWRWLAETNHEIVAVYAEEDWQKILTSDPWRFVREKNAAVKMVDWLKTNTRDFTFEQTEWSMPYTENRQPIRPGFSETWNVGIVEPRYRGTAELIEQYKPDSLVWGMSLENTSHDCGYYALRSHIEVDGVDLYLAGSANLFEPVAKGDAFDWEAVSSTLIGRYQQLEEMPEAFKSLMAPKFDKGEDSWTDLGTGYDMVRAKLTDVPGKDLDQMFAKYGSYGKWRSEADPTTYMYRGFPYRKFAEILEIDVDWDG